MTKSVQNIIPILEATFNKNDWHSIIDYARQQIKPTPKKMSNHDLLVEEYTKALLTTKHFKR